MLAYVRFSLTSKTRHERADGARAGGMAEHEAEMRAFLGDVLKSYERVGVGEVGYDRLGSFLQVRYGSTAHAKRRLGEMSAIGDGFGAVQRFLYRS